VENLVLLQKYACDYNVLIVEDCKHVNLKLREYLERFFLEIDTARDGLEGIEKFENKRYDIVITDINMPKLDGNGFVENLIKIEPNVQIIVVSAFGNEENILTFNKFGIVNFIQKPIDNLKLVDSLLNCIENIKTMLEKSNITYALNDDTYETLLEKQNSGQSVELINSYKGVTINQQGFIVNMNTKTITIKTTDMQYRLIKGEKRTIISIGGLNIRVNLQYVDKQKQQLVLKKFETLERTPKSRKLQRVIPDKNFTLSRYHKGETLNYEVISLSSKSISVRASSLDEGFSDNSHSDLVLGFSVSYSSHYKASHSNKLLKPVKIRSKSHIFRIDELADNSKKVVFILELTSDSQKLLERYVIQRETDILYELCYLV